MQFDFIWSYVYGAMFAAAGGTSLQSMREAFNNRQYMLLLVFLGVFFSPAMFYLTTAFPEWKTFHTVTSPADIHPLLMTGIAVTNITQGILGFWVSWKFCHRGEYTKAHRNWMIACTVGWIAMFTGWDTQGLSRLLYDPSLHAGLAWQYGASDGWEFTNGKIFPVVITIAAVFLPLLYLGIIDQTWKNCGKGRGRLQVAFIYVVTSCGVTTLLALLSATLIREIAGSSKSIVTGYAIGIPIVALAIYAVAKGRLFDSIAMKLLPPT